MNKKQNYILKTSDNFNQTIYKELKRHKKIKITGLGTFILKSIKSKMRYDLKTKTMIKMNPYIKVTFKPTKKFKLYVQ